MAPTRKSASTKKSAQPSTAPTAASTAKKAPTVKTIQAKAKPTKAPAKTRSTKAASAKAPATFRKVAPTSPTPNSAARKKVVTQKAITKKPPAQKKDNTLNLSGKTLWPKTTELISLEFTLRPLTDCQLYPQYTIGLHAWFLYQIRDLDPELSAYLHDSESEKAFSLTGLDGQFTTHSQSLQLQAANTYQWRINSLSAPVTQAIATWLKQLPDTLELKDAPLTIESVRLAQPATTYNKLLAQGKAQVEDSNSVSLSFTSPTSFKRKGHHLPIPWPANVFHSYLRRWNHFAEKQIDQADFIDWIDNHVIIQQHQLFSTKVVVGKQGSVTGFTGAVTYRVITISGVQRRR